MPVARQRTRRCQIVRLTQSGEALFTQVFPAHMAHLAACFAGTRAAGHKRWQTALRALEQVLRKESA